MLVYPVMEVFAFCSSRQSWCGHFWDSPGDAEAAGDLQGTFTGPHSRKVRCFVVLFQNQMESQFVIVSFFWKRWPYFCLRFYFQVSYKQLEGWLFVCLLICMLNLSLCLLMLQHWIACSQVKIAHMYSVEEFFPRQFLLSDFVWSSILILLPQLPHCQAQLEETSAVSG